MKLIYFLFAAHVEKPKIRYSGQKLIKLVRANTPAIIKRINPNVSFITFVK